MTTTPKKFGLIAALLLSTLLIVAGLSLQEYSAILHSSGRVAYMHFTVTGVDGVYAGADNSGQHTSVQGSDAAVVINTVFGWLSSGQGVEFIGNFTIYSAVTQPIILTKNAILDFRRANVTGTHATGETMIVLTIRSTTTILGGHWIGTTPGIRIRIEDAGASNSTMDGCDIKDLQIQIVSDASHITLKNLECHDSTLLSYYIACPNNLGNNVFENCTFRDSLGGGIYVNPRSSNNQFLGCTFDNLNYHAMYLDAASASGQPMAIGQNIVSGCTFSNHKRQGGIQVKCKENRMFNNTFRDFTLHVGISIYSEYAFANANDNEVYNNSFTNMPDAIWLGAPSAVQQTLRNKIHDNTFTNVTGCISLNYGIAGAELHDTWIYYNRFDSCANPFPPTTGDYSLVADTVIAYNEFDAPVPTAEVAALHTYVNTLIYENAPELEDYPVPLPPNLPIPPP